jgi:hypothetical protein
MSEPKEICGKCKHPLASHTKHTRRKVGTMTVDPALLPPKPYDIRTDRPAGESGCTECDCPAWEPANRAMNALEIGGAILLLAAGHVLHGGKLHLDVTSYHGGQLPTKPFNVLYTATAQPIVSTGNSIYLSRIPL